jgi:hypothetical protein
MKKILEHITNSIVNGVCVKNGYLLEESVAGSLARLKTVDECLNNNMLREAVFITGFRGRFGS